MATDEENTKDDPNPTLPEHIISEIFSRLPAESLLDLEDECESLKSLISTPEFIKTHLSRATNDPLLTHHHLLLINWPYVELPGDTPYMKISSCSVHSLLNDDTVAETYEWYNPAGDDNIHLVGYCNGLFCLTSSVADIFLWNPFTTKYTRLPKYEHGRHKAHGFCYDEPNDDYKVFAIFGPGDKYEYNVSVYSSKSGGWRIIGDYYFGQIYRRGKFANGAIHSLVGRKNMQFNHPESYIIVSIDIKTETYRQVSLPPKGEGAFRWPDLETFGESLSVLYYFKTRADFWVMKECGVKESWTKLFTIPFVTQLPSYNWIKPLCISVSGDIMLLSGSTIVVYNPKDNTFKNMLSTEYDDDTLYVYTYVESLVSPPKIAGSTK